MVELIIIAVMTVDDDSLLADKMSQSEFKRIFHFKHQKNSYKHNMQQG